MKLTIQSNKIRIRLRKSEVARFGSEHCIEDTLRYGASAEDCLHYGLKCSSSSQILSLQCSSNRITILVPQALADSWTSGDGVEIEGKSMDGPTEVTILVEKEFRRLHGALPDPDLYPNPLEGTVH